MGAPSALHVECPDCGEYGTVLVVRATRDGEVHDEVPCDRCEGSGWIIEAPAERRARLIDNAVELPW